MSASVLAITDSSICPGDLLERVELLASSGVSAIILREKHLPPSTYRALALEAMRLCQGYGVPCVLHFFSDIAQELQAPAFHCTSAQIPLLSTLRAHFTTLGASIHSLEEYRAARAWVDYVIIGHIFPTSCKDGARGIELLESILSPESTTPESTPRTNHTPPKSTTLDSTPALNPPPHNHKPPQRTTPSHPDSAHTQSQPSTPRDLPHRRYHPRDLPTSIPPANRRRMYPRAPYADPRP